jgi:hypothetical protein
MLLWLALNSWAQVILLPQPPKKPGLQVHITSLGKMEFKKFLGLVEWLKW